MAMDDTNNSINSRFFQSRGSLEAGGSQHRLDRCTDARPTAPVGGARDEHQHPARYAQQQPSSRDWWCDPSGFAFLVATDSPVLENPAHVEARRLVLGDLDYWLYIHLLVQKEDILSVTGEKTTVTNCFFYHHSNILWSIFASPQTNNILLVMVTFYLQQQDSPEMNEFSTHFRSLNYCSFKTWKFKHD